MDSIKDLVIICSRTCLGTFGSLLFSTFGGKSRKIFSFSLDLLASFRRLSAVDTG